MTDLRSALAVILDEAACPQCLGEGIGTGSLRPLGEVCWACKGAGLAGDLDPHTLARLTRWATYSQQGREMVAACLPGARVAGPWDDAGYRSPILDGDDACAQVRDDGSGWIGTVWLRAGLGGDDPATNRSGFSSEAAARAWCDEQLRAAGWVLVGPPPRAASREEA